MYLYFDRTGVLKEIINDESLRQGNYGINKIYVYVENRTYTQIAVSYVNSDGDILGPQVYNTFTNPSATTPADNCYIPYNPERDLKYFKYWTPYKFLIIDLEATVTELNGVEVALGPGPLDVPGIVHCSLSATLENSSILQLGDVNFKVQEAPGLNNSVAPEHYLSLSNYLYLQSELNKKQQKLYRHTVILRTANYVMVKIVFLSSKEENYIFTEIKELVAGDDIYQVYPEVSTSEDVLQYIATYSLTVSNDKLYNIRILFGESITKSMTELVDIYNQTVEEL